MKGGSKPKVPSVGDIRCPVPKNSADRVLMGHGSGGRLTSQLIEQMIVPAFRNPELERLDDQAHLSTRGTERVAFTTDSYVITPIFFPGGDIGELAINGTINDLAVGGARPMALSLAFILEEGLAMDDLARIIDSASRAAERAGVPIVTGDTKVVGRGCADRVFINTSGVGAIRAGLDLGMHQVRPGDAILLSGTIGDHGVAIMAAREGLDLQCTLESDTAPLHELCGAIVEGAPGAVRAMRDPTRGGLAATLVETAKRRSLGIDIDEADIPIDDRVRGACELLGLDPMLVANEGKVVVFVAEDHADQALEAMQSHPLGEQARRIGRVTDQHAGHVVARTTIGGERIVDLPFAEPLPRIC